MSEFDLIDTALAVGTTFDWISPLTAAVEDVIHGPAHTFLIWHACGCAPVEIQWYLESYGIQVWGLMVVEVYILLTVREEQAAWAEYLLDAAGVPVAYE